MKKALVGLAISIGMMQSAVAGGMHHHHHHRHHQHHNWWVAPAIVGGVILGSTLATRPNIITTPAVPSVTVVPQTTIGNCLLSVYNPYMNRYDTVVVNCEKPMNQ